MDFGGKVENGRMQIHAVALSSEFGRLQAMLEDNGSELLIERAMGVGETPLKVVLGAEDEVTAAAAQLRTR